MRAPFKAASRFSIILFVSTLLAGAAAAYDDAAYHPYSNGDPLQQIRFTNSAGADAKRQQLINYIWTNGLPTNALPAVTTNVAFPSILTGVNTSLVARIDKLDATVTGRDFHSISYFINPVNTLNSNKLVIVHQGHDGPINVDGLAIAANAMLQRGYSVIVTWPPMFGPNTDITVNVSGTNITINGPFHEKACQEATDVAGAGFRS